MAEVAEKKAPPAPRAADGGAPRGSREVVTGLLARQGILVAFAVFMIGFALANDRFLDPDNVMGVIRSSAILGVMALGVTFVVISGNLDLSVGSMMSFATIVVLDLHDQIGPAMAIPAMFAMTLALGAINGFLVGYLRLNSLIVTLGMLSAIHGLTLTYSGGKNMDIADRRAPGSASSDRARRWAFRCRSSFSRCSRRSLASCWRARHSGARSMPWAATARPRPSRAFGVRGSSSPAT